MHNPEQQIRIITRNPEQYTYIQMENISAEEDLEDRTIRDYQNCCVVFNDMLDSNQKLRDPFYTRRRLIWLFVLYQGHTSTYLKEQIETIRI